MQCVPFEKIHYLNNFCRNRLIFLKRTLSPHTSVTITNKISFDINITLLINNNFVGTHRRMVRIEAWSIVEFYIVWIASIKMCSCKNII